MKAIVENKGERTFQIDGLTIEAGKSASIDAEKVEGLAEAYKGELIITIEKPVKKEEPKKEPKKAKKAHKEDK